MPFVYDGNFEEHTFEIPELGEHIVEIAEATEEVSAQGNDMLVLVVKVLDGKAKGSHLWDYIVYNDYAGKKIGNILHACGMDATLKRNVHPDQLVGATGGVVIRHEIWQGEKRAKIAYWKMPSGEAGSTLEIKRGNPKEPQLDDIPF